jgi:hypothetical protein
VTHQIKPDKDWFQKAKQHFLMTNPKAWTEQDIVYTVFASYSTFGLHAMSKYYLTNKQRERFTQVGEINITVEDFVQDLIMSAREYEDVQVNTACVDLKLVAGKTLG